MIKAFLISIPLLISVCSYGQKISEKQVDKFTGQKRIETDYITLKIGLTDIFRVKLRTVDTTIFITFYGTIGLGVVGRRDPSIFLFEDKSTFEVSPTSIQSYDIGKAAYSSGSYTHQYRIYKQDLEILASKKLASIRRYYNNNYTDIDIKEKNAKKVNELASIILAELNK